MSFIRKLEREMVKAKIKKDKRSIKRCFEQEWSDFREKKYITKDKKGNIISDKTPRNTMRKKQSHFDNVEQYTRFFAYMDSLKNAKAKEATAQ